MRRLVLLRHAKAVRPEQADSDFERGLTSRGRDDALDAGRRLAALGLGANGLDALVSTAARTRQTWRIASAALPPARVAFQDALYLAEAEDLARSVDAAWTGGAGDLLVIGHNPGLKDYATLRLAGSSVHDREALERLRHGLPTACFLMFEHDGHASRLARFDGPARPSNG